MIIFSEMAGQDWNTRVPMGIRKQFNEMARRGDKIRTASWDERPPRVHDRIKRHTPPQDIEFEIVSISGAYSQVKSPKGSIALLYNSELRRYWRRA